MELVHSITAEEFAAIQEAVGFGTPDAEQTRRALENSEYICAAVDGGRSVGMGRLVGDMVRIAYVQDLFIIPEYQGKGVGSAILADLLEHVRAGAVPGTRVRVGLMAVVGRESYYLQHGFRVRPNEHEGAGMVIDLEACGNV